MRITADTPSGTRVFSSRHAIVAVPLPVLKDGDIAFEPPLPAPKLRAIQQLEVRVWMRQIGRCNFSSHYRSCPRLDQRQKSSSSSTPGFGQRT